jgi:preprotein translocase subunit SecA
VLAYDDVLNTQRLAVYADRHTALLGSPEDVEARMQAIVGDDEDARAIYEKKKEEVGGEVWTELMRRLILQTTDTFWLEHLEYMEYLRRSVSLRAYGQRDPLIEYRREGLLRFRDMEAGVAFQVREALPRIMPADDARIRAEEEKVRARMVAASEGGDESAAPEPIQHSGPQYGRNDTVTITRDGETQTLKYKKAEPLLAQGWTVAS